MSTAKAIRMFTGSGDSAATRYSCGVVEQAKEDGVKVIIVRRNKAGKPVFKKVNPRMVHRPDPLGTYGDTHELAGEGKYVAAAALDASQKKVVGAQHVNPYLRDDGAYASIVEAFKHNIGRKILSKLCAKISRNRVSGTHFLWEGARTDGCVTASDWMTAEELWSLANEVNSDLRNTLRKSKSGRKGVKSHKSARDKFFGDLDVLRRATCVVDVGTGERVDRGGATPYSKPLEQFGFAIDKRYLTYGVNDNGDEVAQYYYRLAIGRPEPHTLPRKSWAYEDVNSPVAFLSDRAKRRVGKAIAA